MRKAVFAAALCLPSLAAHAVPITYTVTDTGSGTLGSANFTNALITVSFMGDTSNVTGSGGFYTNPVGTATVQIGSGPVATFTTSVAPEFFDNQTFSPPAAGIGSNEGSILDTEAAAFATYTGTTAIGPIIGAVYFNAGETFATSLGNFDIATAGADSTFTATLGSSVTPEPSSIALLGTGLLGVAGVVRRRLA